MSEEAEIKRMKSSIENGETEVEIAGMLPNVRAMVVECIELLEAHEAKNYVQFDLIPRLESRLPGFRVTVQRAEGKSPAGRVIEMEAEVERLRTQLAEATAWEAVLIADDDLRGKIAEHMTDIGTLYTDAGLHGALFLCRRKQNKEQPPCPS